MINTPKDGENRNIILHVGIGKTGTSAIQKMLFENRDVLAAQGVFYPDFGLYGNAHHLFANFRKPRPSPRVAELIASAKTSADGLGCRSILISSEQFMYCNADYIREFLSHFSAWRISVILFVRRQPELIASAFLQKLKEAPLHSTGAHAFFCQNKRAFDYSRKIAIWRSLLNPEDIHVKLYDKHLLGNDVCSKFLGLLGLVLPETGHTSQANLSLIPEFVPIIQLMDSGEMNLNTRAPVMKEFLRLSNEFRRSSSQKLLLEDEIRDIESYYAETNRLFAAEYLKDKRERELFLEPYFPG